LSFSVSGDKNVEMLRDFGLTANQAKVYLAIARLGLASVGQISKASKVRREDVYRIIPKLEKLGLTERILGTPNKVRATPLEDALSGLIKREENAAHQKAMKLRTEKEEFLKHFNAQRLKPPIVEGAHFAVVSQRDQILSKGLNMIKKAQKEVNMTTSADELMQLLTDHASFFKTPLRRGTVIKVILGMPESFEPISRILKPKLQEFTSRKGSFEIKYLSQPSGHYLIADYEEAMVATSTEGRLAENPYLWTDDDNLVELMQTNFEESWNTSINASAVQTNSVSDKVSHFVGELKPRDHIIFVYQSQEAKHSVLFSYLKAGLEKGEAAAYVASEETPSQIREAMKQFGINVEECEKTNALKILGYTDIYLINGKFDIKTIMSKWSKLHDEAVVRGFKGLRVTGEMSCFFEHNLVEQLVAYERSLHRVLELPIMAICAYNAKMLAKARNPINLYTEIVRAHGAVLFAGVDDELGKIEIREA
jgi:sugar-specific transcriptional regulator TrmB